MVMMHEHCIDGEKINKYPMSAVFFVLSRFFILIKAYPCQNEEKLSRPSEIKSTWSFDFPRAVRLKNSPRNPRIAPPPSSHGNACT